MATDNRSITITLKLDGKENASTSPNTSIQTNTEVQEVMETNDGARALAKALASQAISVAANEVLSWSMYYWDRELNLSDDYIAQRQKSIALTQIQRGISYTQQLYGNILVGNALGGPAGAILGGIIGLATVTASVARSNIQGQDQQNIRIRQMDARLEFTRARAGWSTQAASIGEDL